MVCIDRRNAATSTPVDAASFFCDSTKNTDWIVFTIDMHTKLAGKKDILTFSRYYANYILVD